MAEGDPVSGLEDHLGYWLRFVSNHVSHAFAREVESRGVTVAEWVLMREMFEVPAAHPSQLADRLGMTRGAISKLIERLDRKGLLARSSSEGDRRFQTVELTAAGRLLVPDLGRLADENDRKFFGDLAPGRRADLLDFLRDLARRHGWNDRPIH